jgi:hypothetical protein
MEASIIKLFPLPIVVFEGERLNLHIFEPRYKKLIGECVKDNANFGIPLVLNGNLQGTGTLVRINAIAKKYFNGDMDIVCEGLSRFEILDLIEPIEKNQYSTGLIQYLSLALNEEKELNLRIADLLQGLITNHQIQGKIPDLNNFNLLQWWHKCGLSLKQELELVYLQTMRERQLYLIEHLKSIFNSTEEINQMKKMILLNGHFKKLNQSF